ncbi:hypothetical protein KZO01_08290 [Kurthia zopfii]|uniref:Acidobacterial duplicated orphan permease n=1 Tax=Kurthia zopfii TaxID=1650 RepID=A0A8B4QE17_9BACL|nr:FtsX-like permease family protein [Kurthia zopfii]PWI22275.1 hypothetical protein DF281_07915 [Kurthia zopfii]TDR37910.1 FtsX-like permease family protein [Kurthia zopfii]GEK30520.1 hypothetical protein KZO01_08290 [Kurthia zopfii]STX11073.1 acidobacterial duplicated orphan permease [Kurthia zopfii]
MPYKKSLYLFIYYIIFVVFVCLVFSSLAASFENSGKLEDGLTEQSFQMVVSQDEGESVRVKTWLDFIREKESSFILMKRDSSYVSKEIFLQNYPFRLASEKRIEHLPDQSAFIDQDVQQNSMNRSDGKVIHAFGKDYIVYGTFNNPNDSLRMNSTIYYSMNEQNVFEGEFLIDGIAEKKLRQFVHDFQKHYAHLNIELTANQLSIVERITFVFKEQMILLVVLMLTLILIVINTIATIITWIESRKEEIQIRYLVGGSSKGIQWDLLKDYWLIVSCSFLVGTLIAYAIYQLGLFDILIQSFRLDAVVYSFIFCFVLGTSIAYPSIRYYDQSHIVKRGEKVK